MKKAEFKEAKLVNNDFDESLIGKFKTVCDDAGLMIEEVLYMFIKKSIHDKSLPIYMKYNSEFDLNEFIYYVVETYKRQYEYADFKNVVELFENYNVFHFICENVGVLHLQSLEETCEDIKRYIEVKSQ